MSAEPVSRTEFAITKRERRRTARSDDGPAGEMAEERIEAIADADRQQPSAEWQRTLWAMVGIQFVMTMSFSMLTPIMPLFLPVLGVRLASAVDLWAGILAGITSFVAAFASPLWGRLADRHGRKLMLLRSSVAVGLFAGLMGASSNVWQVFAASCADGRLRRVFEHRDRAGGEPGSRGPSRLCPRLAQHRATRRLAGRPAARRRPCRR